MNILINTNRPIQDQLYSEFERHTERKSQFGEKFATALVVFYTSSVLIVSAWSAVILKSGIEDCGGPIQHLFEILKTTGIV